jgi:hypothetical protein
MGPPSPSSPSSSSDAAAWGRRFITSTEPLAGPPPPWPPPAAPGPSEAPVEEPPESIAYTWRPEERPDRIVIEATIPRAGLRRVVQFEIEWERLNASQQTQVWALLARHSEGVDDHLERVLAVSMLYDLSVQQAYPTMSLAERRIAVGDALTIPEKQPSKTLPDERQLQAQRLGLSGEPERGKTGPSRTLGVSPLLIWIKPRKRAWLASYHHIDVAELELASAQLFHGLAQFESHSPEADFKPRAEAYTAELITHHLRVRRVGQLLGGRLGEAIVIQTKLCIETLRNQNF